MAQRVARVAAIQSRRGRRFAFALLLGCARARFKYVFATTPANGDATCQHARATEKPSGDAECRDRMRQCPQDWCALSSVDDGNNAEREGDRTDSCDEERPRFFAATREAHCTDHSCDRRTNRKNHGEKDKFRGRCHQSLRPTAAALNEDARPTAAHGGRAFVHRDFHALRRIDHT
ncbi:MAG: hypothetical protein RL591_769 [Planctomycetota bacterium]